MYRRISSPLWIFPLLLSASAFANEEVDWSVFATWCPISFKVCTEEVSSEVILPDEVLDPDYHSPNKDDTQLFSELMTAYQALTKGRFVPGVSRYVHQLEADIEDRKKLYRYAMGEGAAPELSRRSELLHYRKELMYLKSLQEINQKQRQLLDGHLSDKKYSALKAQVDLHTRQLNDTFSLLVSQLKRDIETEKQVLRYFTYKREQTSE